MKKRYSGVLTVEAAFIMPIIIFVVLMLLQYSLTLYDRVVCKSFLQAELASTAATLEGRNSNGYDFNSLAGDRQFFVDDSLLLKEAAEKLERTVEQSLLFSNVSSVKLEKTLTGLSAKINIKHKSILPILARLKSYSSVYVQEEVCTFDRENKTRLASALLQAFSEYTFSTED